MDKQFWYQQNVTLAATASQETQGFLVQTLPQLFHNAKKGGTGERRTTFKIKIST